ncbi:SSU ribosomal protein S8p (S15Ae) [hydrothermal vent metagenome]|uniref:SSU ribosomal protein S8p (S15Ae) n=1 Tax=hydrothermal vent metagenome TaxID=652676 RepID=A0A3B1CFZ3_9ZZZZ
MSMSDPIADMLTRMRNAVMARHAKVSMPSSKLKAEIAALLSQEGYVRGFKIVRDDKQGILHIHLKYSGDMPALRGSKRVSKPGLRVYTGANDIPRVLNGLGAAILSTNIGILTDAEAREEKVGGEVLCYVW